jgi:hypothetical protein
MTRLRRRHAARRVIAMSVAAAALAGCGSSGPSGQVATPRTNARWLLLRNCVMKTATVGLDNEVVQNGTTAMRVYRNDDLIAGVNDERTFASAEAAAKRHQVPAGAAPSRQKTASWLAIGNVTYFFSYTSTPAEVDRMTACLTSAYAGRPKWPANVPLNGLSSPGSPYS